MVQMINLTCIVCLFITVEVSFVIYLVSYLETNQLDTILLHAIEVDVFPLLDPFSWNMLLRLLLVQTIQEVFQLMW